MGSVEYADRLVDHAVQLGALLDRITRAPTSELLRAFHAQLAPVYVGMDNRLLRGAFSRADVSDLEIGIEAFRRSLPMDETAAVMGSKVFQALCREIDMRIPTTRER